MPLRSTVFLLAAPAPIQRQCLCFFLYPPHAISAFRKPGSFLRRATIPQRRQNESLTAAKGNRPFHSSASRHDEAIDNARNHYETLKVSPGASTSEIKKSFYALSKTHHPDVHPAASRPGAAKRFMRISEAYAILSTPTKRAKYDREHMNLAASGSAPPHSAAAAAAHPHRQGSYSSTGPAGGRPASGLSRRRGTFRGPPPSFFRSGGWGAQTGKRRAAHEDSMGGAESSSSSSSYSASDSSGSSGTMGGMGPGQNPFGHGDDVPHFDREGHERTGRHTDRRREARRAADGGPQRVTIEPERGVAGMFFMIGGVLLLSFLGPFVISRLWYGGGGAGRKPKEKGKKGKG
ncbi:DnaJ-domain-containing protein [Xylariaceae sp. FL1651]|nr:DnaJ-domain-containing protein [Xylariaceae sp. FL1651]